MSGPSARVNFLTLLPPRHRPRPRPPQDILNALKVKLSVEKFSEKNDRIRSASLLPKQLREAKARKVKLAEAEKEWVAKDASKKLAAETLQFMKGVWRRGRALRRR